MNVLRVLLKNIADDLHLLQEIDEDALLFYKVDTEGAISSKDMDDIDYYLNSGSGRVYLAQ